MTYVQGSPDYGYEGWMGSDVAAMLPYLDIVVTSGCERPTTLLTSPAPLPRFFSIFLGSAEIVRRCTDGAIDLTKLPEEVDCLGRGSNMLPCPISSLAIIRRAAAGWVGEEHYLVTNCHCLPVRFHCPSVPPFSTLKPTGRGWRAAAQAGAWPQLV